MFGKELNVESLAFQEQDSVLAACATTAVWSMLNKASLDFHTILKSPSEITRDADNLSSDGSRLFPNSGLNLLQICKSIFKSGLVTELKNPDEVVTDADGEEIGIVSNTYLKKILNAYSPIGIPIILIIRVPNGDGFGLHAITVTGFKEKAPQNISPTPEISWYSDNIEKFYAHDDQWGPFPRVLFQGEHELITNWTVFDKLKRATTVTNIVVPLYPKIRINYEDIEAIVSAIDSIFTLFFDDKIKSDLVWDIKLDYSEKFKVNYHSLPVTDADKLTGLIKSLPKYLWVASCYIGEFKILDFTFDATDVNNAMLGQNLICYLDDSLKRQLFNFLQINQRTFENFFHNYPRLNYYKFILDKLA